MAQIATLGVVGLAVLVKKPGEAPVLSRQGKVMVAIAILTVLAEGIALALIPTSHAS
jgi:hypothetical protein